jgi:D-alanine-D-alanine ligase
LKKLRLLVVVHEELMPPDDVTGCDLTQAPWKMEFDVLETLKLMGHEITTVGAGGDVSMLDRAIERTQPQVIFNLLEDFGNVAVNDQHWVSFLELRGIPYTGCNPRGLLLARDKAISKKLLGFEGVRVPDFDVYRIGEDIERPARVEFPLIVKSLVFDGSVGISQASVVTTDKALHERIRFVHLEIGSDAIVEEYVEGRELYVGVLGNDRLRTFPVWELHLDRRPKSTRLLATDRVKWSDRYQKRVGVRTAEAKLPEKKAKEVQELARRVYRSLELSGYGRIDFRLAGDGEVVFLEANPNPQLAYGEDFAESAEKAGISYESLLARIINLAIRRDRST